MKLRAPFRAILLASCLSLISHLNAAERVEELAKMLPPKSNVVMSFKNCSELIKDWDSSAIGRFIEDPATKKWMAPLYNKDGESRWNASFKENDGSTFREQLAVYTGAVVVSIGFNELDLDKSHEVAIGEIAGHEKEFNQIKEKELAAKKKEEYPKAILKTIDIGGAQVSVILEDDTENAEWIDAWTIVNGLSIESSDKALLESTIAAVKSGGEENKHTKQLARIASINGYTSDLTVYADTESFVGILRKKAEQEGDGPGIVPVKPAAIMSALEIDELKTAAVTFDMNETRSNINFLLLHSPKPKGILPAILRGTNSEVPNLSFLPSTAQQVSVNRQSLAKIYDSLMDGLQKIGPMSAMITAGLTEMEKKAGVNLRKDLFGSLDDTMAQAQTMKVGADGLPEINQVTLLKLKNKARFEAALKTLVGMAGNGFPLFEESQINGQTIHTLKASLLGQGNQQVAYAITNEYLIISRGSGDLLRKVLARIKSKTTTDSIWDAPTTQDALAQLPKGYTGMSVSDGASIMKFMADLFTQVQNIASGNMGGPQKGAKSQPKPGDAADENEGGLEVIFDTKAVPGEDVFSRYFGITVSGMYSEDDVTLIRVYSLPAKAK